MNITWVESPVQLAKKNKDINLISHTSSTSWSSSMTSSTIVQESDSIFTVLIAPCKFLFCYSKTVVTY